MSNKGYDITLKLLMVGNSSVGKTCILLRYCNEQFSNTYITTIGIDFKIKRIKVNDKVIKLQLWDTAGQERFRTITTSYFRGSNGALVVYDITNRESFDNVVRWIQDLKEHGQKNMHIFLVGNKTDLNRDRLVSKEEGMNLAKKYKIPFFECSAKTGADYLITKINELVTHPGFEVSVGATVQPGFQLIPGTDKSDWYARFQEIKGQAFLQAVQELRGMGALSNQEGDSATKAIQRMSTSQSEKEFKAAAQDFQGIIQRGIDRNRVKLGMQPLYGTPPASQQSQQRPQPQTGAGKVRKYNPQTGQLE